MLLPFVSVGNGRVYDGGLMSLLVHPFRWRTSHWSRHDRLHLLHWTLHLGWVSIFERLTLGLVKKFHINRDPKLTDFIKLKVLHFDLVRDTYSHSFFFFFFLVIFWVQTTIVPWTKLHLNFEETLNENKTNLETQEWYNLPPLAQTREIHHVQKYLDLDIYE